MSVTRHIIRRARNEGKKIHSIRRNKRECGLVLLLYSWAIRLGLLNYALLLFIAQKWYILLGRHHSGGCFVSRLMMCHSLGTNSAAKTGHFFIFVFVCLYDLTKRNWLPSSSVFFFLNLSYRQSLSVWFVCWKWHIFYNKSERWQTVFPSKRGEFWQSETTTFCCVPLAGPILF